MLLLRGFTLFAINFPGEIGLNSSIDSTIEAIFWKYVPHAMSLSKKSTFLEAKLKTIKQNDCFKRIEIRRITGRESTHTRFCHLIR